MLFYTIYLRLAFVSIGLIGQILYAPNEYDNACVRKPFVLH